MIEIEIRKRVTTVKKVPKNFIVKSTPTEITEQTSEYGARTKSEVKCVEEYEVKVVDEEESRTYTLLSQQIIDDSEFDLAKVIAAINGIKLK